MQQQSFNLLQVAWAFAASALGALVAAFYGVRFGLDKFKGERAFDRRLEWYSKLAETIHVLINRQASLNTFIQGKNSKLPELLDDISRLAFEFQEMSALAELYARSDTYRVVTQAVERLNGLSADFAPDANDPDKGSRAARMSMAILKTVSVYLARDIRDHLGLETLPHHRDLPAELMKSGVP